MKKYLILKKVKIQLLVLILFSVSCKDFVDVAPPAKELTPDLLLSDKATATSTVLGLQAYMWNMGFRVLQSTGLAGDELRYESNDVELLQFNENAIVADNLDITLIWRYVYSSIYTVNTILESLPNATALSLDTRQQLEGEARFQRATCYFYLVNLFGEIPLNISTDYLSNSSRPRSNTSEIYALIISDLIKAKQFLAGDYHSTERIRPNKGAATALLARAYLYQEKWLEAEAEASAVIDNPLYDLLSVTEPLGSIGNSEVILQAYPLQANYHSYDGLSFIVYAGISNTTSTYLTNELVTAFEAGDKRLANWVASASDGSQTYYYPFKYKFIGGSKPYKEYSILSRLAEQYLIRAEARAMQNDFNGAREDLNEIRTRAELSNTTATNDKVSFMAAIEQERRVELFTEVGHRWFDLKRWDRIDAVLGDPITGKSNWEATDALFPIPEQEILNNPNIKQNLGY